VKLDDLGVHLSRGQGAKRSLGVGILKTAPYLMKGLSIAGTAAMFLVGGGIIAHGIPVLHHLGEELAAAGGVLGALAPTLFSAVTGIVTGFVIVAIVTLAKRLKPRKP
jgi:predicted DNA repair protein MutK